MPLKSDPTPTTKFFWISKHVIVELSNIQRDEYRQWRVILIRRVMGQQKSEGAKGWGVQRVLSPFASRKKQTKSQPIRSIGFYLSLKFIPMLWSNSITFSINSFSFGIRKNQKKKGLGITAFFPFYQFPFFFFILFSVWLYSYVFVCQNSKDHFVCLMGQMGFAFCQVFINSEFGLWFSWMKVFYDTLSDC